MTTHEARRMARHEMNDATDTLIREFAHLLPAGTVIRHIARAREELLRSGVRHGLAHAAESMARSRLQRILPAHAPLEMAGR